MNLDFDTLAKYTSPLKTFFTKYGAYIYLTIVVAIICFLLITISGLINTEPTDIDTTTIKVINIDSEMAQKILDLKDQNVIVSPENNTSRTNPF